MTPASLKLPPPAVAAPRRRHADKLLTLDRALLVAAATGGIWVGTANFRAVDVDARVQALEMRAEKTDEQAAARRDEILRQLAVQDREGAVQRTKLENIEKSIQALAESMARFASRAVDNPVRREP